MAGYWPSLKDLLYSQKITPKNFAFCGNKAENPKRERYVYLARSGSQSEHRIRFILPARGASHIVRHVGCSPFNRKNRLVEYCSKWDASKFRMEISMGCACSIPWTFPQLRIDAYRPENSRKEQMELTFSVSKFWTTFQEIPFPRNFSIFI